jgi:hypothetical protein
MPLFSPQARNPANNRLEFVRSAHRTANPLRALSAALPGR